jgi:hypothetical protein
MIAAKAILPSSCILIRDFDVVGVKYSMIAYQASAAPVALA